MSLIPFVFGRFLRSRLRHAEDAQQALVHGFRIAVIAFNHEQQPDDKNYVEQIQKTFHA